MLQTNVSVRDKLIRDFPEIYTKDIDKAIKALKLVIMAGCHGPQREYELVRDNLIKQVQNRNILTKMRRGVIQGDSLVSAIIREQRDEQDRRGQVVWIVEQREEQERERELKQRQAQELKERNLKEQKLKEQERKEKVVECMCCLNATRETLIKQCSGPNGHPLCVPCVKKYVETELYEKENTSYNCINCSENCNGKIPEKVVCEVLDPKVLAHYNGKKRDREMNSIKEAIPDIHFKKCQHCDKFTEVCETFSNSILVCMSCFEDTCLLCDQIAHPNRGCLKAVEKTKRQEIEEKLTEAFILKCNKCSVGIVKDEACNVVTCSCRNKMCWLCKENIKDHSHFDCHLCGGGGGGWSGFSGKDINSKTGKCIHGKCSMYFQDKTNILKEAMKSDATNADTSHLVTELLKPDPKATKYKTTTK